MFTILKTKKEYKASKKENGHAMLITSILLVILISSMIGGLILTVVGDLGKTAMNFRSKQSWYLAEAALEDAIWRLNSGLNVSSGEELALFGQVAGITVATGSDGHVVSVVGRWQESVRAAQARIRVGSQGVSFQYGIQTGVGGFSMANNAKVIGNVYANGDIRATQQTAYITGSAQSANRPTAEPNQSHIGPSTPNRHLMFGDESHRRAVAQSFVLNDSGDNHSAMLNLRKVGEPGNLTARLVTDDDGRPSDESLTQGTLPAGFVTGDFGWVEVVFDDYVHLQDGVKYWLVLEGGVSSDHFYHLAATSGGYSPGVAKVGRFGGQWYDSSYAGTGVTDLNAYFQFFLVGAESEIESMTIGEDGIGSAYAHRITDTEAEGKLYCQEGSFNNQPCDDSEGVPTPQSFPISSSNLAVWQDEAEFGEVISGDHHPEGGASTLGPARIEGDLVIPGDHILTIKGTTWVEGNIYTGNNVHIKLDSQYEENSGVLFADGYIDLANNAFFQGSGHEKSFLLLLSNSSCPNDSYCGGKPAIQVLNNVDTVILNAQQGTIEFANNAGAKEATAHTISMQQEAVVEYDTGLADVNFISGPGGRFEIFDWREIE